MPPERKIMSTGFGESKSHAAPAGAFPPSALDELHFNGTRIGDLPVEIQQFLAYGNTDEALAERDAKPKAHTVIVRDELDGKISERRAALQDGGIMPWEAPDPLRETVEKHKAPGMRRRFLSPAVIDKQGMRGFKPVIGQDGDPVRVGNMILGEMPEKSAVKRNEFYRGKTKEAMTAIHGEFREHRNRFHREAKLPPAPDRSSNPNDISFGLQQDKGSYVE